MSLLLSEPSPGRQLGTKRKGLASLSVDLDDKWAYMKTHRESGWEALPTYLYKAVPRALEVLRERDLRVTFFVVGQDVVLDRNREVIRSIATGGHELGSHSFSHQPLCPYSPSQIDEELARTEEGILEIAGTRPVGFRAPGFSWSHTLFGVLAKRAYLYDSSILPTWIAPLARSYYFRAAEVAERGTVDSDILFGHWTSVLRPIKAHIIEHRPRVMVEVPVTVTPILRVPFHGSYIMYLGSLSFPIAVAYFKLALLLCRITDVQPSLLLHPVDFLGTDDVHGLELFPGMTLSSSRKLELIRTILKVYCDTFTVVSLRQHASSVLITRPAESLT